MGFLGNLFGGKKGMGALITDTQTELFKLYGVGHPTDAQKMKASVYICLAGIAIINDVGDAGLNPMIERLVEETKELTKTLRMRVADLAGNQAEMDEILADFPAHVGVMGSTMVNGLAAFDALYQTKVERVVNDILRHRGGPTGTPGYAAIVVADGVFGKGKAKDHFMEVSMCLMNFMKRLPAAM